MGKRGHAHLPVVPVDGISAEGAPARLSALVAGWRWSVVGHRGGGLKEVAVVAGSGEVGLILGLSISKWPGEGRGYDTMVFVHRGGEAEVG